MGNKNRAKHRALALIKDEHRSLAAVVHAMQYLSRQMVQGKEPNQILLCSIALYISQFPEKLHHPAEDRFIFAPLRAKTHESKDVLDALEEEHASGEDRAVKMSVALNQLAAHTLGAVEHFAQAVDDYARFYWAHMIAEETIVLPLAERMLDEVDWVAAAEGFAANHDPMYGPDTANEFDALFKRIVYLAPAPIGLGGSE